MSAALPASRTVRPTLCDDAFEAAFPFFLLLDADLRVTSAGAALLRAIPSLIPGSLMRDTLMPTRPRALADHTDWRAFDRSAVVLRGRTEPVSMFRGQIVGQEGGGVLLLLSPVVTKMDDLRKLGLQLGDLALHDATGDMLLLQQALQTSLDDAQRLAQRLRVKGQQLQWMTELSGHGVAYFDQDGTLLQHNPLFASLLGWPHGNPVLPSINAVTQRLREMLIGADADRLDLPTLAAEDALAQSSAQAPPALVVMTRTGAHLKIRYRNAVSDAHVLYIRDVTTETQLDRMKTEFMTTAAHELRTPMTSIYGFSEMLVKRTLPPEKARHVAETIYRQSSWMVALLNEVLDLARLEARHGGDFYIETVSVPEWLEEVILGYCDADAMTRFNWAVEDGISPIAADRLKAGQALGNVLSNAFKYSPHGGTVTLTVKAAMLGDRHGVRLVVEDSGIGMTRAQLTRIFERFYRADPSGNIPGSGLGMSLVQQIVHLHGGAVDVTSEPGVGTQVSLWLPAARV